MNLPWLQHVFSKLYYVHVQNMFVLASIYYSSQLVLSSGDPAICSRTFDLELQWPKALGCAGTVLKETQSTRARARSFGSNEVFKKKKKKCHVICHFAQTHIRFIRVHATFLNTSYTRSVRPGRRSEPVRDGLAL